MVKLEIKDHIGFQPSFRQPTSPFTSSSAWVIGNRTANSEQGTANDNE